MDTNVIRHIAEEYGTPLYLYDGEKIRRQYHCLMKSLPEKFEIFYSMKANPLLGICQMFKKLGSHIEVASAGELYTALAAGFAPGDIIFTSPGKSYEELKYAIDSDIYSINIECIEEAKIIHEIAKRKQKTIDICLRINPDFELSDASIKMTGVSSQFGIPQADMQEAFGILQSLSNLNIMGIHVYLGTQVLSADAIVTGMEATVKMALQLSRDYQFSLAFLDMGGGFGVPYFPKESPLNMARFKEGLAQCWNRYGANLSQTRIAVESGRFLMAEAGLYLTSVLYQKQCKGSQYVICDGGSNQHAASAFLGRRIRNNFPMSILGKESDPKNEAIVVGPLCTPTDVIGQKVLLAAPVPGDILVIQKSGAYGLTHSPSMFLSHQLPAEVIYDQGRTYILRERGERKDFLKRQKSLF